LSMASADMLTELRSKHGHKQSLHQVDEPSGGFADAWKGRQSQQADSSGEQQRTVGYGQKEFEQYQARWAQSRAQDREDKLEMGDRIAQMRGTLEPPPMRGPSMEEMSISSEPPLRSMIREHRDPSPVPAGCYSIPMAASRADREALPPPLMPSYQEPFADPGYPGVYFPEFETQGDANSAEGSQPRSRAMAYEGLPEGPGYEAREQYQAQYPEQGGPLLDSRHSGVRTPYQFEYNAEFWRAAPQQGHSVLQQSSPALQPGYMYPGSHQVHTFVGHPVAPPFEPGPWGVQASRSQEASQERGEETSRSEGPEGMPPPPMGTPRFYPSFEAPYGGGPYGGGPYGGALPGLHVMPEMYGGYPLGPPPPFFGMEGPPPMPAEPKETEREQAQPKKKKQTKGGKPGWSPFW